MPDVTRTDYRRRQLYHVRLIKHLSTLDWRIVNQNLDRVEASIQGEPALEALSDWRQLVTERDLAGMERVFLASTDHADLMRIISPFAGILSDEERMSVIREVPRVAARAAAGSA